MRHPNEFNKNTINNYGKIVINGISLSENNPINYSTEPEYISCHKDLGISYTYVDTSIISATVHFIICSYL